MRGLRPIVLLAGGALLLAASAGAQCLQGETAILSDRDNTLYEGTDLSNGVGQHLFTGRTNRFGVRRTLLRFDVAGAIAPGATIVDATLWLHASMVAPGATIENVAVHPLLSDWGEGPSDASGPEGAGAPAGPGDATWFYAFFASTAWATDGGDFAPASATTPVADVGWYAWASAGTATDVQGWLDDPASNFGWILIGNEAQTLTAKRFDSRDHPDPMSVPVLCVAATAPSPIEIPSLGSAGLVLLTLALAAAATRRLSFG